jgi:hypothetical protein
VVGGKTGTGCNDDDEVIVCVLIIQVNKTQKLVEKQEHTFVCVLGYSHPVVFPLETVHLCHALS